MIRVSGLVFIWFILGFLVSCAPGNEKKTENTSVLPAGIVHDPVSCAEAPEIRYAIYLPAAIMSQPAGVDKRFPLVLAFDPHGDGKLPVDRYKALAEKYGFILMGSDNSRNGLPLSETETILSALFQEIRAVYPVDTNRICLMGFSGGSRIASLAALTRGGVKAVIGCGAGFPNTGLPERIPFDFFGIAGTADFNLGEMTGLDLFLAQTECRHFLRTYPGIHEWPPVPVMEEGILWIWFNAMRDGMIPPEPERVNAFIRKIEEEMEMALKNKRFTTAADYCRQGIAFAEGLVPVDSLSATLRQIERDPAFHSQTLAGRKILEQEKLEQQALMESLFSKDVNWWRNKISSMNQPVTPRANPQDTLKNRRLLSWLSLVCYSNANAAIQQNNLSPAENILLVYEMADPGNPEANYLSAVILMKREDPPAAMEQLEKAVEKGFSDKVRAISQPEFQSLKNTSSWFDLLKKMK